MLFVGIASPNKRPTLFDVFRRKGSDGKKDKEAKSSGSDKDSVSSGSGIMNSMKAAIYSGKAAEAPEGKPKKVVKDGSAHPHAGSDARVRKSSILWTLHENYLLPFFRSTIIR